MPTISGLTILILATTAVGAGSTIERWVTALGGRDRLAAVRSLYREATLETGGLSGTLKLWETSDGRFRNEVNLAAYSSIETFDGVAGMKQIGTAPPHKTSGIDLERAITTSYSGASAMFFPERRPGRVTVEGDNVVVIKPEGGIEFRITLDPQSWLPATMNRADEGDRVSTFTFVSTETVDGIIFAKEVRQSRGDPRSDAVIRFTKTLVNPPVQTSLFTIAPDKGSVAREMP